MSSTSRSEIDQRAADVIEHAQYELTVRSTLSCAFVSPSDTFAIFGGGTCLLTSSPREEKGGNSQVKIQPHIASLKTLMNQRSLESWRITAWELLESSTVSSIIIQRCRIFWKHNFLCSSCQQWSEIQPSLFIGIHYCEPVRSKIGHWSVGMYRHHIKLFTLGRLRIRQFAISPTDARCEWALRFDYTMWRTDKLGGWFNVLSFHYQYVTRVYSTSHDDPSTQQQIITDNTQPYASPSNTMVRAGNVDPPRSNGQTAHMRVRTNFITQSTLQNRWQSFTSCKTTLFDFRLAGAENWGGGGNVTFFPNVLCPWYKLFQEGWNELSFPSETVAWSLTYISWQPWIPFKVTKSIQLQIVT